MPPPPICVAVREAWQESGISQGDLALELGEKQQTISGWMLTREPRLDDLMRLEEALGKPRGFLLRAAGYSEDVQDCRDCLRYHPTLLDAYRDLLLASYDSALALSKSSREQRTRKRPAENSKRRSRT